MPEELLDVVDERDKVVGIRPRRECTERGLLHRAIVVFLLDSRGWVYIQKRARDALWHPRYWSASCMGHVSSGETYRRAARREMLEELGIKCVLVPLGKFVTPKWKRGRIIEYEYVMVFEGRVKNPRISLSDESEEGRFVPMEDFRRMVKSRSEKFTPETEWAFEHYSRAVSERGSGAPGND